MRDSSALTRDMKMRKIQDMRAIDSHFERIIN
jgi:hypothetical protein